MPYLTTPTTTPTRPRSLAAPVTRVPAAASVLVREVLVGPVRSAAVVATGRSATYLDVDGRLLAVVAHEAVRLPCAVVLAGDARPPAGPGVTVGAGAIRDGGRRIVVNRWFDPRVRVACLDAAAVGTLVAAVRARPRPDALLPADAVARLASGLAAGHGLAAGDRRDAGDRRVPEARTDVNDMHATVAALVGRGSGLTPAGDDLLAGALAALRAVGSAAADALGAAVRNLAPGRTTRLSAALLAAADAGAAIPQAEAVLRALAPAGAATRRAAARDDLVGAVGRLLGVGHTSGWCLAAGLAVGASHALAAGRGDAP